MFRKLFPIFFAMVVVLAFGSVHAQTTVTIAVPDTTFLSLGSDIVVTGAPAPSQETSGSCWVGKGFLVTSPGAQVVIRDPDPNRNPSGTVQIRDVLILNLVAPGTRFKATTNVGVCTAGGVTYNLYSGDVSPTPATIIMVVENFSSLRLSEASQVVITGKPTPSETFTAQCAANHGMAGVEPGAHFVAVGDVPGVLDNLWSPDSLQPGTRLVNLVGVATCFNNSTRYLTYIADVVSPVQGGPLLVEAPAGVTLESNSESVAKSNSDSDGISNFVCITPGSGAQHTELWCDVPIERGDRIVGFHSPLFDPDSGCTYWWAELEY